jgi:hypothetical protein
MFCSAIEFARLHALGTARAPGLPAMTRFADITQGLLHVEMDLHRSCAGELGISSAQLEREEMLPTTQGYTDFLVRTAAVGDFVEFTAALLPCIWGYAEIAERLAAAERPADARGDRTPGATGSSRADRSGEAGNEEGAPRGGAAGGERGRTPRAPCADRPARSCGWLRELPEAAAAGEDAGLVGLEGVVDVRVAELVELGLRDDLRPRRHHRPAPRSYSKQGARRYARHCLLAPSRGWSVALRSSLLLALVARRCVEAPVDAAARRG